MPDEPSTTPKRTRSAEHATVLVIGTALATLSSAIVPIVVVRLLGKADVASLLALFLVYDTVALFCTSGFPQTLMYHLATRPIEERRAIVMRSMKVLCALGCAAGALLLVTSLGGDLVLGQTTGQTGTSLRPLALFAFLPLVDLPSRLLPNLLVAEGRSRPVATIGVLRAITNSLSVLVPVALGWNVWLVALSYVVVGVVRGAVLVAFFLSQLYGHVQKVPCALSSKELLKFAVPLGATDLVSFLNQQLDRYLILLNFPAVSFALYQAGAWQVPVINDVPYQVGTAYAPRFAALFKSGKPLEAIALWQGTIKKVSLIVLPVMTIFIVAAEEVIELLFTADYLDSAPVFRLYSMLTFGRVAAFGTVIVAAGRPDLILRAAVLSFCANLVLSVPLVFTIGFLGPALGTVLAFIPMVAFYCWCIAQASSVPTRQIFPLRAFLQVAAVVLVTAIPGILFKWFVAPTPAVGLAGIAVLQLLGFGILGTLVGQITREDWHFLLSRVRRTRSPDR